MEQIHKKIYLEKEKDRMIRIMKQSLGTLSENKFPLSQETPVVNISIIPIDNVETVAKVPVQAKFNRIENFVDKFL